MIYIDENFGIMVDDYNYITGEVYKKSDGKILLRKTRRCPGHQYFGVSASAQQGIELYFR